jgi:hypothetical protein
VSLPARDKTLAGRGQAPFQPPPVRPIPPRDRRAEGQEGILHVQPDTTILTRSQQAGKRHRQRARPGTRPGRSDSQAVNSPVPEILRAQRRHLAQLRHHRWQEAEATISAATRAIYSALRTGIWIPGQRQRLQQLAPGTWDQALADVLSGKPSRPDDGPGQAIVEIAIYSDVVWLAARSLKARSVSHRAAS